MASAEYQREWRKRNPEKAKQHGKTRRMNHPKEVAAAKRVWAKNNPDRLRVAYRKYRYGITEQEFDEKLKKQENKCAMCHKDFTSIPRVDHDHATGRVRDLLCQFCNIA